MSDSSGICGDNRFDVIKAAKKALLRETNIKDAPDEMKCLDSFLFRCWQMGWLDKYDECGVLHKVKDAIETDVLYAPGESPTYEQVEKVRKVYAAVLKQRGIKKEGNRTWTETT